MLIAAIWIAPLRNETEWRCDGVIGETIFQARFEAIIEFACLSAECALLVATVTKPSKCVPCVPKSVACF